MVTQEGSVKFDLISKTPDYTSLKYSKIRSGFSEKFNIPENEIDGIMFFMVGWTIDNKHNLKEVMET